MFSETTNKNVTELATEYMRAYYAELSLSGADSPKTQEYFACWQLYKDIAKNLRDRRDSQREQVQQHTKWSLFIKLFLEKLRSK